MSVEDNDKKFIRIGESTLVEDDPRHGTHNAYSNLGCRCRACRDAWAEYIKERRDLGHQRGLHPLRARYAKARAAGYSPDESRRRRSHWSDPLREDDRVG